MKRADNLSTTEGPEHAPAQGSLADREQRGAWECGEAFRLTLDESVSGWAEETSTFSSDAVPVPFEHLGDHS